MSYISHAAAIEHVSTPVLTAKYEVASELRFLRKMAKAAGVHTRLRDWHIGLTIDENFEVTAHLQLFKPDSSLVPDDNVSVLMQYRSLDDLYFDEGPSFVRFCLNCL